MGRGRFLHRSTLWKARLPCQQCWRDCFARTIDDLSEDEIRRIIVMDHRHDDWRAGRHSRQLSAQAVAASSTSAGRRNCRRKFPDSLLRFEIRCPWFHQGTGLEAGPRKIRVNSIHPGGIVTPLSNPTNVPRDLYDLGFRISPGSAGWRST